MNDQGEVVEGDWPVNPAAFVIHSQIHAARPDVVAAAHSHSVHGKAWSALRRPLDPLTQDACAFYGDHAVFDDYTGVVLDARGGQAHRPRPRRQQGGHPGQPRAAHRRPAASTRRRGGSSPWSARARRSCSPRRPARRCSIDPEQAEQTAGPGRRPPRRLAASSSRSTTGSSTSSPTCSTSSRGCHGVVPVGAIRTTESAPWPSGHGFVTRATERGRSASRTRSARPESSLAPELR